jgi:hypothetical protein
MDIQQVTTPTEKTNAWGKKLAEMRRQKKPKTTGVALQGTSHTDSSTHTLIGLECLALGAGALYYQYRTYQSRVPPKEEKPSPTIDKPSAQPKDDKPSSKSRLVDMM